MARLKIIRCKIQNDQIREQKGAANTFEATINPESYSHKYGLSYSGTSKGSGNRPVGKAGTVARFANTEPEKLDFTIHLDGTGVVPDTGKTTVADQIAKLRDIVYEYDGDTHEPNPVKVVWGKGLTAFFGRLTSMSVDYTLFHPDGTALRAKVTLSFVDARTEAQESREAGRNSPDLTHVVRVVEGDTLPLLCQRIYDDAGKYLEIARLNDLDGFRALVPDTLLRFPPMR
ncbi:MAG: peptidoglycan-binding protein [Rhodovulum sp.]